MIWLSTNTRPDIAYAVSRAASKMAKPSVNDWIDVKRIFGYLMTTRNLGLYYGKDYKDEVTLEAYADADFAADYRDRKSRTGYIIFLNNCPIIWQSRKQRSVSTSTTEAEYMAASDAAQDLIWINQLLEETNLSGKVKCTLHMDNTAALNISKNPVNHGRSKHIDVRYHYLREKVNNGQLQVVYTRTEDMIADALTKPLPAHMLKDLRVLTQVKDVRVEDQRSGES